MERIDELIGICAEVAPQLRAIALEVDADPSTMSEFGKSSALHLLQNMSIPADFLPESKVVGERHRFVNISTLERAIAIEELSVGDAGVVVAAPGPSLSGLMMADRGSAAQKAAFFSAFFEYSPSWTFFALSEPRGGSDAASLETSAERVEGGYRIRGAKLFIGNAARSRVGIVFARVARGPLGIEAFLIDARNPGLRAVPLEMLGLRALQICEISLEDAIVPRDAVIGEAFSPAQRGLVGALKTFNFRRPSVAACALGLARACLGYIRTERKQLSRNQQCSVDAIAQRLATVRLLVHEAARQVDLDDRSSFHSSAAKMRAARLVIDAVQLGLSVLGPASLLDHPLMNKWYRDARAFEYLEGTTGMQLLNCFSAGKVSNNFKKQAVSNG
jgi:alkylation response protein AidB-like acyl-CoA dehydrogenase